jgi:8-oxo-dGTP diphosphatase
MTTEYKKPSVAACVAIFSKKDGKLLIIKRKTEPFRGKFMFPGGFLEVDKEDVLDTAVREAEEETGASVSKDDLVLIDVRSDPKRDPRGHVIDIGFLCVINEPVKIQDSTEETFASWIALDELKGLDFAFDHKEFAEKVVRYIDGHIIDE